MSIWFFIWFVFSAFLLGFLVWTIIVSTKQKAVWKAYAAKHKLRYQNNKFLQPPEMSGTIEEHSFSFFTGEHISGDMRNVRKLTAIELQLSSTMPIEGGLASGSMVEVIKSLNLKEEYTPKTKAWKVGYMAASNNKAALKMYLTPPRLKSLLALMGIKAGMVILVFRGDMMLLRFDTARPLNDQKELGRIVEMMMNVAKVCELIEGESRRLKAEQVKKESAAATLKADEETLDTGGLSLEDDV